MPDDDAETLRARLRAAEAQVKELQDTLRRQGHNGAAAGDTHSHRAGASAEQDARDQWQAAARGDIERLRQLFKAGASPNQGNYDQRTAMHLAAAEGLLPVLRFLLEEAKASRSPADRWGAQTIPRATVVSAARTALTMHRWHAARRRGACQARGGRGVPAVERRAARGQRARRG